MSEFEDIHRRVLQARIGIAEISIDSVSFDQIPGYRSPNAQHVDDLTDSVGLTNATRWAHPIDVIITESVSEDWLDALASNAVGPTRASHEFKFIGISGQHRILAARKLREEWPLEDHPLPDWYGYWPATIYSSGKLRLRCRTILTVLELLQDNNLLVWIHERNVLRSRLGDEEWHRWCLLDEAQNKKDAGHLIGLLGWTKTDGSSLLSLRFGAAWKSFVALREIPFYHRLARGTVVDWASEYRLYPFLAVFLQEILQQHRQIKENLKDGRTFTMESVWGPNWLQDTTKSKTGKLSNLKKRLDLKLFSVDTIEDFSSFAFYRDIPTEWAEEGDVFFHGAIIPTIYDLDIHKGTGVFAKRVHKCGYVASMVCLSLLLYSADCPSCTFTSHIRISPRFPSGGPASSRIK
jgi:hypothetical protein